MNNQENRYKKLLEKFAAGTLDDEGVNALMQAVERGEVDNLMSKELDLHWEKTIQNESGKTPVVSFESLRLTRHFNIEKKVRKKYSILPKSLSRYAIAASLAGILLFSGWKSGIFTFLNRSEVRIPADYVLVKNSGTVISELALPDGSEVFLEPGAVLHYPGLFKGNIREVYLDGNAFFKIKHLNDKRFIVKGDKISAEVLGTSFWVHQDKKSGQSDVEVRTGKVKVTKDGDKYKNGKSQLVVLPNQQAILNSETGSLQLALADSILPLISTVDMQNEDVFQAEVPIFLYKKASPINEILDDFSKNYGVSFIFKNDRIRHCFVSGDFSGQDFYKNLDIICLMIGATYKIEGTNILIDGAGCEK